MSNRVVEMDRRSVLTIGVKVDSKSELIENRENNPRYIVVIGCCDDKVLSRVVICSHTV